MAEQILSVPRLQDKSLIDCIEKMAEVVKDDSPKTTIFVLGGVNIQIDLLNIRNNPQILTILEKTRRLFMASTFPALDSPSILIVEEISQKNLLFLML